MGVLLELRDDETAFGEFLGYFMIFYLFTLVSEHIAAEAENWVTEKANEVKPSSDSTFSGSCKDVWCISRDMHHPVDV